MSAVDIAPQEQGANYRRLSNLRATIIDPGEVRWHSFVAQHPVAGPFHQPGWTSAVSEVFGYRPRFHVLENSEGELVAAWPAMLVASRLTGNRMVCLPFCHRAGPLIDSVEQGQLLFEALKTDAKKWQAESIEVRDWPVGIATPSGLNRVTLFSTHSLDLSSGIDMVLQGLSHGPRNSIRRARRNGVTVRLADSDSDLSAFYEMYVKQRKQQKLLPQPAEFVEKVHENIVVSGNGFIVVAEYESRVVCAILAVGHGKAVTSTHSAADPLARKALAMPLAMWKLLETACERGYTHYDLGRTSITGIGLQNYKDQWGARADLPYYFYGRRSGVNTTEPGGLRQDVLNLCVRLAPESVLKRLSRPLYRHLG